MAKTLVELVNECKNEWRAQGATGDVALSREDCEWIVREFNRLPSRAEWANAGVPNIGDAHTSEGYAVLSVDA